MKNLQTFEDFIIEKMSLNKVMKTSTKDYTWVYQTGKDSAKTAVEINKSLNALGIKSFVSKTTGDTIAIPTKDIKVAFDKVLSKYENIKQFDYSDGTKINKDIVNESFHMPDGTPIGVDKNLPTFDEFLNESVFDVQKNASKLKIFGVMPVKIIHAGQWNDYQDSGSSVTDRIIPDFNQLEYKYRILPIGNGDTIRFGNFKGDMFGGISYTTAYGADRIISYQNQKMQRQSWYLNLIFATARDAQTAWENFKAHHKIINKK
jgi:hypothetical protein